jgi:hypothetical protein
VFSELLALRPQASDLKWHIACEGPFNSEAKMAKQIFLDRQRALRQIFRWQTIYAILNEEATKENPRSLEQIAQELQNTWEAEFIKITAGYKKKPKFPPLETV